MEVLDFSQLSDMDKFFVIIGIVLMISGVIGCMANMMNRMTSHSRSNAGMIFGIVGMATGMLVSAIFMVNPVGKSIEAAGNAAEDAAFEERMNWEHAKEDGFVFYYNGEEVDPETVDRSQYQVSYDYDGQHVYLSDPAPSSDSGNSGSDTYFVPVFIPYD